MKPAFPGKKRRLKGIAILEFALILPVVMIIVLGMVDASIALYNKAVLTNASREAARYGVVLRTPPASEQEIRQKALDYCGQNLITFGTKTNPTVTPVNIDAPLRLKVTVSYPFAGHTIAKIYTAFAGPIQITSSAVMSYE